jgi:hypothetical protein
MHRNSLECWRQEAPQLGQRALAILEYIKVHPGKTDRQIMSGMGFRERNSVQPRITELLNKQIIREAGNVPCDVTRKRVRTLEVMP